MYTTVFASAEDFVNYGTDIAVLNNRKFTYIRWC